MTKTDGQNTGGSVWNVKRLPAVMSPGGPDSGSVFLAGWDMGTTSGGLLALSLYSKEQHE